MMRKGILIAACLLAPAMLAQPDAAFGEPRVAASAGGSLPQHQYTSRLIVKLHAGKSGPAAVDRGLLRQLSAAAGISLRYIRPMSGQAHVYGLPQSVPLAEAAGIAAALMKHVASVEYAEADARMFPMLVPNDPEYAFQWHYDVAANNGMNLPGAWDITTGSPATVAAVIDTGILAHADMDAAGILPGYDFISEQNVANDGDLRDADPTDPGDWITPAESAGPGPFAGCPVQDSSWHGTHVAGTIGANSNNGLGVAGVNWHARILPVRVMGKCGGFLSDVVDGMNWAAGFPVPGVPDNASPADVLNLSLGGAGACGSTYQFAINQIALADKVVVVAAGNSGADAAGFRPANCNNTITVAAHDKTGFRAYYSNFGNVVEIMAPGGETFPSANGGVLSTLDGGLTSALNDNIYVYYQGTSMAAPHVSGLVTLLMAVHASITPAQVLAVIRDTSRPFVSGGDCDLNPGKCGAGIADAQAAVLLANTPLAGPTGLTATAVSSSRIDLIWADHSGNESGFEIERKTGAGGSFSWIATVAANIVTYSDISLAPSTGYFYRVRAYNAYADSVYSSEAAATTGAATGGGGGCLIAAGAQSGRIWAVLAMLAAGIFLVRRRV